MSFRFSHQHKLRFEWFHLRVVFYYWYYSMFVLRRRLQLVSLLFWSKSNSSDVCEWHEYEQLTFVTCCSLAGTTIVGAEVRFGSSRFDFRLRLFVDVISVYLERKIRLNNLVRMRIHNLINWSFAKTTKGTYYSTAACLLRDQLSGERKQPIRDEQYRGQTSQGNDQSKERKKFCGIAEYFIFHSYHNDYLFLFPPLTSAENRYSLPRTKRRHFSTWIWTILNDVPVRLIPRYQQNDWESWSNSVLFDRNLHVQIPSHKHLLE